MTDNNIGDEGAQLMSEILKMNTMLKILNLSCEDEFNEEKGKEKK